MRRKTKEEFINELFGEMYDNLCFYVCKRYGDKDFAEDVAQETFLEAYRHADKLMSHPRPKAWLYLAAKNEMMKMGKKRGKLYPVELDFLYIGVCENGYGKVELTESMKRSVGEKEYRMFEDYFANGYSSEEVAEKYGQNKGGIRMRMCRLKRKLKSDIPKGFLLFALCAGKIFYY